MGIKIRINGKWMEIAGVTKPPQWGDIQGSLAAQADLMAALDAKVPVARKVAGKPLSADVTLGPEDVDAIPVRGGTLSGYLPDKLTSQVRNIRMVPDKPADSEGMDGDIFVTPGPAQPFVVQDPFGITIDGVKLQEATADKYGVMTSDQAKALAGLVQTDAKVAALETSQRGQDTKLDTLGRNAVMKKGDQTLDGTLTFTQFPTCDKYGYAGIDTRFIIPNGYLLYQMMVGAVGVGQFSDMKNVALAGIVTTIGSGGFLRTEFTNTRQSMIGYIAGTRAFEGSNLTELTFTADHTYFFASAVSKVRMLKRLTIGGIHVARTRAFADCDVLDTVVINNPTPGRLDAPDTFENTPIASGTGYIYVPDEAVDTYKAATNWTVYASQIKPLSALPPEVAA